MMQGDDFYFIFGYVLLIFLAPMVHYFPVFRPLDLIFTFETSEK
jgi:hypothetical protein